MRHASRLGVRGDQDKMRVCEQYDDQRPERDADEEHS
jgi:hypothetical protein